MTRQSPTCTTSRSGCQSSEVQRCLTPPAPPRLTDLDGCCAVGEIADRTLCSMREYACGAVWRWHQPIRGAASRRGLQGGVRLRKLVHLLQWQVARRHGCAAQELRGQDAG